MEKKDPFQQCTVFFPLLASNLYTPCENQSPTVYMFHFLRKPVIVISYFATPSSSLTYCRVLPKVYSIFSREESWEKEFSPSLYIFTDVLVPLILSPRTPELQAQASSSFCEITYPFLLYKAGSPNQRLSVTLGKK